MTDTDEDPIEISEEEFEAMVDEAVDIIAMALPDDADDAYWAAFRAEVERRASQIVAAADEGD